ncbi:hypothetical protein D3C85_1828210 [compost metagenome]
MLIVQVRVGGHRHIGQQQARQVAARLPLFHEQTAFRTLAMLAFNVKIQPGLHVQFRPLRLLA